MEVSDGTRVAGNDESANRVNADGKTIKYAKNSALLNRPESGLFTSIFVFKHFLEKSLANSKADVRGVEKSWCVPDARYRRLVIKKFSQL